MTMWQAVMLKDVVSILGDGLHGTPEYDDNGEYYFINGNNLCNGKIVVKESTRRASKEEFEKYRKNLNDRTILVSINGTIGNVAVYNNEKCFLGKSACYFNVLEDVAKDFIYYVATSNHFQTYISEYATGTTIKNVPLKAVREYSFILPKVSEQKAISAVLTSLDDKIDLLHRQNKTLEAMAATLFRQWFVEEAQDDWEEIVITDLFEVRDGTHDSPKQASIGKPLITSKHILDGRLDIGNAYLISDDDFNQVNQRSKVDTGDILFSMIGTIGLLYLEQSRSVDYAIKNIGLFKTSQNPDWALYTYLWLRSSNGRQFIDEHKSGSTQEYVSLGSLRSIVFQKPPINVLQSFNKLASGYFSKMILNRSQIRTLEKLRDTLLPKLMSGEVRVA